MSSNDNKPEATRIRAIDFVKGVAICLIILAHSAGAWKAPELNGIYSIIFHYLDVFGPPLFIFLSALSVVFSIKRKEGKMPLKAIRKVVFIRGFSIIGIGFLYNLFAVAILGNATNLPFPFGLWSWTILIFIGFAQIVTYYVLKLARGTRIFMGLVLIFIAYPLYPFLNSNLSNPVVYIIHYIVISPLPHNPLIPYVSICFFSSVFGEIFVETMKLESKEAKLDTYRTFVKYGLLFVIIGIFLTIIDPDPFIFDFFEFPLFVWRSTPSNMFYSTGISLLLLGFSYYYIDILLNDNLFIDTMIFYGQVSLTLFFLGYIGLTLYFQFLDIFNIWFMWIGYNGFLGFFMYFWNKFYDGKYSLEYFMVSLTKTPDKRGNAS